MFVVFCSRFSLVSFMSTNVYVVLSVLASDP